jgi:hypothetical protein
VFGPKAGWRTTEFWVTVLVILGSVVASATSNLSPRSASLGATVAAGLYALSRGISKTGGGGNGGAT